MQGVSVVICCYNGSKRLPSTLACLAAQRVPEYIPWEVIVVDNASTDDTYQAALRSWPQGTTAQLRVVREPRLGLIYARYRGLREARYECISLIDDDNWVNPDWVQVAGEVMSRYPYVGACGGLNQTAFDILPPWWFEDYQNNYAVGTQGLEAGDVTSNRGYLWGAGLIMRKCAWEQVYNNGLCPLLTGHKGGRLTRGEDSELCYALRLLGWRLWYEPRLRLRHFLPAHRLNWRYLRSLSRGDGASTVFHDTYLFVLNNTIVDSGDEPTQKWKYQTRHVLKELFSMRGKLFLSFFHSLEGDPDVLLVEKRIGRLLELLRRRRTFDIGIQRNTRCYVEKKPATCIV